MSDDSYYYDVGAGAWRARGEDSWLGERREDDTPEAPEWRDQDEPPPPSDPEDDGQVDSTGPDDPMDDPDFRAALRGHRELSGRVVSDGRRRGNHPTGRRGIGVRGLRITDGDTTRIAVVRPTGRQLGRPAPAVGRPSFEDAPQLIERLLGPERIALLRRSFAKRGRATLEERAARVYLALMLLTLDTPVANRAAAELLISKPATEADLRKIGDLRRRAREYDQRTMAAAEKELRERLAGPRPKRRRKKT